MDARESDTAEKSENQRQHEPVSEQTESEARRGSEQRASYIQPTRVHAVRGAG
jgi:hypothetical protein